MNGPPLLLELLALLALDELDELLELEEALATHVCVVESQTGVGAAHWLLWVQPTQVFEIVLHSAVAPVQAVWFVAEHCPHAPVVSHAGVGAAQSESDAHAWQVFVVVLQTGVVPEQFAFVTQLAQTPFGTLHVGVGPVHWVTFVAEHCPHAPEVSHAGVAPPQSASVAQP